MEKEQTQNEIVNDPGNNDLVGARSHIQVNPRARLFTDEALGHGVHRREQNNEPEQGRPRRRIYRVKPEIEREVTNKYEAE